MLRLPYDAAVQIDGPPLAEPAGPLDQLLQVGLAVTPTQSRLSQFTGA
jgi:hypothetical protein